MISASGQSLFLPFYHGVYEKVAPTYIKHLYPIRSLDQFRKDLDVLLKHFEPIDLPFLIDYQKNPKKLKKFNHQ